MRAALVVSLGTYRCEKGIISVLDSGGIHSHIDSEATSRGTVNRKTAQSGTATTVLVILKRSEEETTQ
jgi:hypothetical protein